MAVPTVTKKPYVLFKQLAKDETFEFFNSTFRGPWRKTSWRSYQAVDPRYTSVHVVDSILAKVVRADAS